MIRKTARKRLSRIEQYISPGTLLDIGCATGFFLDEAQKRGWKSKGIEISEFAASYAKTRLKLDIQQGDIQLIRLAPNSYNLITLWDVIEHLPDAVSVFTKLRNSLKKNGVLVFATPDVGSIPARLTKQRWIGYKLSDEHLAYFSKTTIEALLTKSGFSLDQFHHTGKYVSYSLFADRVAIYSPFLGKIATTLSQFFPSNMHFYMNAFDIMCVYARKSKIQ